MKTKTFVFTGIFLSHLLLWKGVGSEAFAQGEANWWYFGENAGLHFNGGTPAAVTNGKINTNEGTASVSDAAGNLLFYTDGIKVWDKNHVQMPNGFGLMGNYSTTQSALIIPKPGSATSYYIFTAASTAQPDGIRYSEIDMTLNAGLGDVTTKNFLLHTPSCEKLTGIKHCNNKDVWVVTHDYNSDAFRAYLVTAGGVNPAVVSNAGLAVSAPWQNNALGQLKGSPDGKKLASAVNFDNYFELFDFNNSTGIVSNAILLSKFATKWGAYGVEFSPDGTKMYSSRSSNIYQFDLCAGDSTAIVNSGVIIGTSSSTFVGSLQLGPDKKIYAARDNASWLGVINNPNTLGAGCNYVDNGVSLAGKISRLGLPNFVPFKQAPPPFTASDTCRAVTFTAPTNCSGSGNAITSVSWNFGDPASTGNNTSILPDPTHTFTGAGTYTVTLVLNYACGNDTIQQNVIIATGPAATISSTPIAIGVASGATATVNLSGGTPPFTYLWNTTPPQTTQTATGLDAGLYCCNITDANNCTNTVCVTVDVPCGQLFIPNAFSPNGDGENDEFCLPSVQTGLQIGIDHCIKELEIIIYDRWGEKVYESKDKNFCWNGRYKGKQQNTAVFVYYLDAVLTSGEIITKRGNISLVK